MAPALLLLAFGVLFGADDPPLKKALFLHEFPVLREANLPSDTVELTIRNAGDIGELSKRGFGRAKAGRLRVELGGYPASSDAVAPAHLACSFVIDCAEPPVRKAAAQAQKELGQDLDIGKLSGFVDRYITDKSYGRSFDFASTVARRRQGDCTEHAVLLAALARLAKIPARVVFGLVLVEIAGERPVAFGHAWVEHHRAGRWRVADAAISIANLQAELRAAKKSTQARLRYLPMTLLSREDAGYSAALMGDPTLRITEIRVGR